MNQRIAVCVPTFQRPRTFAQLMEALRNLELPNNTDLKLVVVDNDSESHLVARPPVIDGWEVVVAVEPERGIPFSRNRLIAEAGDVDAIVFFDDDEQPHPDCLVHLVATWRRSGADIVQGGTIARFESTPPEWVVKGGYFGKTFEHDMGEISASDARTSNVLVNRSVFNLFDPPFNTALRLIGGEDTYLFRAAEEAGFKLVSSKHALVEDTVPSSRTNATWLIRRHYRIAWGRSFYLRSRNYSAGNVVRRIGASAVILAQVPLHAIKAFPDPTLMWVESARTASYALGLLSGLLPFTSPNEYSVIHGG